MLATQGWLQTMERLNRQQHNHEVLYFLGNQMTRRGKLPDGKRRGNP